MRSVRSHFGGLGGRQDNTFFQPLTKLFVFSLSHMLWMGIGYSKLVSQDALNNTKGIKSPKLRKQWTMAKITQFDQTFFNSIRL